MWLERVDQDSAGVTAVFSDGQRARGDLLIGADGWSSTVRAQFLPELRHIYAGYVAWRGLVDETLLSKATHAALFQRLAFCLPPREQMLGYPVPGVGNATEPGRRRYNFVWYRPVDEEAALPRLNTDATGFRHEAIPPHLIRPEIIDEMRREARSLLAPQFAEVVWATRNPFFQAIYDLESPRLAFGRVALLGDAAFVARPHCGMGVTKAAGDAVTLTDALEEAGDDVAAALAAYEVRRVEFGRAIVAHSRHLGAYVQAQLNTREEHEMADRYKTPEAVMREVGLPPNTEPLPSQ
jgi:2-polyprenyl-6-methoxyphenol hydroxylase-like FAD-dependent oxidoreductase